MILDVSCTDISGGTTTIHQAISSCSAMHGNALAVVTSVAGQTLNFDAGDPFNLTSAPTPSGTMLQIQAPPASKLPPTTATRVVLVTYFLDNTDPTNPRLMRGVSHPATGSG